MLTQYVCIHKNPSTSFTTVIATSFDMCEAFGLCLFYAHTQMKEQGDNNAKVEFTPFFDMEQETGWIGHFRIISDVTDAEQEDLIILKNEMLDIECDKLIEDLKKYRGVVND